MLGFVFLLTVAGCNQLDENSADKQKNKNYQCSGSENSSKVVELIPFIGIIQGVTCQTCHEPHHRPWSGLTVDDHGSFYFSTPSECETCHGEDLAGGISLVSCNECHHGTDGMAEGHAGVPCETCHDFSGGGGGTPGDCADCHGSSGSHAIHISGNSKGPSPSLVCTNCHVDSDFPRFEGGNDLSSTQVCNNCHSPGGAYDGVNDPVFGAKANWDTGIYNGDLLQPGKERWCVTCHDDDPSNHLPDGSGIYAPNVAGNNSSYGFYVNGHTTELCTNCHDLTINHIDGVERTYTAPDDVYTPGDFYQLGYRLKSVDGNSPLVIPYRSSDPPDATQFRLCFSCHTDTGSFLVSSNLTTNFREDSTSANYHFTHLTPTHNPDVPVSCGPYCHSSHQGILTLPWDSDVDGTGDSDISCPACHNVHGSQGAKMVRTGELIGHTPGLNLQYLNNDPADPWNIIGPLDLANSTGGAFDIPESSEPIGLVSENGICIMCHTQRIDYYRTPVLP